MQTRKELFEAQPFHANWNKSVKLASDLKPPLSATSNLIQNIARLKKATVYVQELIKAADIDLVPQSVWQNFQTPCNNLASHIQAFINTPNESNIDTANNQIDSLLQYLSPYVITGKGAAQAAGRALSEYAKAIQKHTDALEAETTVTLDKSQVTKKSIEDSLEKIKNLESEIDKYKNSLLSDEADQPSIKSKISSFVAEIEKAKGEVDVFKNEIVGEDDDDEDAIVTIVNNGKTEVEAAQKEAAASLLEITQKLDELRKLHTDVFGKMNEDDEVIGGLRAEYASQKSKLEDYEIKQKKALEAILREAKGLLPVTTGAGLASAYATQKGAYQKPIKLFGNLFYVSVAILFLLGLSTLFAYTKETGTEFGWPKTLPDMIGAAFARIPLALPVIWLAYFSAKRRNENRRLEEEYAHKEAIARSFYSFQQQVEKLGGEDQIKLSAKLLDAAIGSVSFNASSTLDKNHDDGLPNMEQLGNLQNMVKSMKDLLPKV